MAMELGIVGLGKMGANMAERLLRGGHRVWGYARHAEAVDALVAKGGGKAESVAALAQKLSRPRTVWIMVPSGAPVDETIAALTPHMEKGDTILDGGNSNYKDTQRRGAALAP